MPDEAAARVPKFSDDQTVDLAVREYLGFTMAFVFLGVDDRRIAWSGGCCKNHPPVCGILVPTKHGGECVFAVSQLPHGLITTEFQDGMYRGVGWLIDVSMPTATYAQILSRWEVYDSTSPGKYPLKFGAALVKAGVLEQAKRLDLLGIETVKTAELLHERARQVTTGETPLTHMRLNVTPQ